MEPRPIRARMKVQNIQPTPNPNAFKFLLDRPVLDGSRDYPAAEDARQDPLAQAIFAAPGVESVYYSGDFVTVTMEASADWRTVAEQVTGILESHDVDDAPNAPAKSPAKSPAEQGETPLLEGSYIHC